MISQKYIEECRQPAYKNRLGKLQLGDDLIYLTVKQELKINNGLKISSQPTNEDKFTGYLSEIQISDMCYSNGSILGTAISKEATCKVLDVRDLTGLNFIPSIGVKYLDNTDEWLSVGKYTMTSQTIDKTAQNSEIKGLDKFGRLDEEYVCSIEDYTEITVKDILLDLCVQLGLELGTTEFINSDIPVAGNYFQKNCKFRDVLSDICELACAWAELGEDGKLYLNWFTDEVVDTLDKTQYSTLERNGKYGEVNCLVIKDSQFEGENVTIQDIESIEANGETQLVIADNRFLNTELLRQQAIPKLWEKLKGFTYVDCKIISYYGKPFLKRGSKIKVEDVDGSYFETYVLTHTFKYDGTFYSEITSPALSKEETKIKNTNLSPKQRLMNAEAQVLKNEATIKLIAEKTEEITSDLENNYYDKETTNETIIDTINGMTNKYTVGGGNNLFKNTGLYFESSNYDSGYDYWKGKVERVNDYNSKTKTKMLLKNGSLEQSQLVANDKYTISFEYERKNELAHASVIINDIEEELGEKGTYTRTIDLQSGEITIKFVCDIDNAFEVYELMCNFGETALAYSQNANEIKTDTVEISDGIKITSTATDSIFKADADGIRTLDRGGNVTTEFLDTGTKTTNLQADKGIIANLLIEEIDGQVWITGLGR